MTDTEVKQIVEYCRKIAKEEAEKALSKYIKVTSATVISVSGTTATVRIPFAADDGSQDFDVEITTSQTISADDEVTIGYWSNLSTAILISK